MPNLTPDERKRREERHRKQRNEAMLQQRQVGGWIGTPPIANSGFRATTKIKKDEDGMRRVYDEGAP